MGSNGPKKGFWRRHTDKVGAVGALFATFCCLGVPWMIAIFVGLGLGFLLTDSILVPLAALFLALTLLGLYMGMRDHRRPWALVLGIVSAAVVLVFLTVIFYRPLVWVGLVGIVAAIILNAWYQHRNKEA